MKPLFQQLKEMIFKSTNRLWGKGFFRGGSEEEQMQLNKEGITYNLPKDEENKSNIKEREK